MIAGRLTGLWKIGNQTNLLALRQRLETSLTVAN